MIGNRDAGYCRTLLFVFAAACPLGAQRLYNQESDQKAQDTVKAADAVKNSPLFERQLKNIELLSQQSFATIFAGVQRETRVDLDAWETWSDVGNFLSRMEAALKAAPLVAPSSSPNADVAAEIKTVTQKLEALRQSAPQMSPRIKAILDNLGDFDPILDYANKVAARADIGDNAIVAAQQISATVQQLGSLYSSYTDATKSAPPASEAVEEMKLELLQLEEDHIKTMGLILARREAELADIRITLNRAKATFEKLVAGPARIAGGPGEEIQSTFRKIAQEPDRAAASDKISRLLLLLFDSASLAARGDTPLKLASLRAIEEEHRNSIRRSAIVSSSYQSILSSGAARLAQYYKGGLKPETVAQLIQALSTAGLIPAVAIGSGK
jgi:hypothetical protein